MFRKMLESSTEMHSVLTTNSKPNCLIIDEIDGAPAVSGFEITVPSQCIRLTIIIGSVASFP